jgi:hypothetical protein
MPSERVAWAGWLVQLQQQEGVRREGVDVHSQLALSLWDAILGGPATVETLRGSITIHVPPGNDAAVAAEHSFCGCEAKVCLASLN